MLLHLAALSTFLLLLPMMLLSLLTAIFTTLLSSAVLGVRLAVGYSGLFMAMVRRCIGVFLFPHVGYLVGEGEEEEEEGVESRFELADPRLVNCRTTTERELAVAVASLKVKVMSRNVGRRGRSGVPMGAMRVDYGTLLRSPKGREDSFGR